MDFGNIINNLLNQMAFFHLGAGNYVMIVVALVFLYLAIRKGFEPLLLIPIAFGMLLVNIYPDIMYQQPSPSSEVRTALHPCSCAVSWDRPRSWDLSRLRLTPTWRWFQLSSRHL